MAYTGIPIFISRPSHLTEDQQISHDLILSEIEEMGLSPRMIGSTKSGYGQAAYTTPLREVLVAAKHCCGGLIMGFRDARINDATPWNQIEGALIYGLGLPLLVFAEAGISSGIFDPAAHDIFVQQMPSKESRAQDLRQVMNTWSSQVYARYYKID